MSCKINKSNFELDENNQHQYVYIDDEYGSLGSGGSYEIYDCTVCGRRSYSPLPD